MLERDQDENPGRATAPGKDGKDSQASKSLGSTCCSLTTEVVKNFGLRGRESFKSLIVRAVGSVSCRIPLKLKKIIGFHYVRESGVGSYRRSG